MKKSFVIIITIVSIMLITSNRLEASSVGGSAIGLAAGLSTSDYGLAFSLFHLTLKLNELPFIFGLDVGVVAKGLHACFTTDWWLFNSNLGYIGEANLYFYTGIGLGLNLGFYDVFRLDFTARLPLGLSWVVEKNWEIFTELMTSLHTITFNSSDTSTIQLLGFYVLGDDVYHWTDSFSVGLNFGFRYWF